MRDRWILVLSTGFLIAAASMTAQTPATSKAKSAAKSAPSLRTPWGDPDLQGTWFVTEDVPLALSSDNFEAYMRGDPAAVDQVEAIVDERMRRKRAAATWSDRAVPRTLRARRANRQACAPALRSAARMRRRRRRAAFRRARWPAGSR